MFMISIPVTQSCVKTPLIPNISKEKNMSLGATKKGSSKFQWNQSISAHALTLRKDTNLVLWLANSIHTGGSARMRGLGGSARMRGLAWIFAGRICYKGFFPAYIGTVLGTSPRKPSGTCQISWLQVGLKVLEKKNLMPGITVAGAEGYRDHLFFPLYTLCISANILEPMFIETTYSSNAVYQNIKTRKNPVSILLKIRNKLYEEAKPHEPVIRKPFLCTNKASTQ